MGIIWAHTGTTGCNVLNLLDMYMVISQFVALMQSHSAKPSHCVY